MKTCVCFRRLWQHVTESLRDKDIEKATEHKRLLEERQRTEERHRAETETPWRTTYFDKEVCDHVVCLDLVPHPEGSVTEEAFFLSCSFLQRAPRLLYLHRRCNRQEMFTD